MTRGLNSKIEFSEKQIDTRQKEKFSLTNEISNKIQAEIDATQLEINTKTKDPLEILENELEVLEKDLEALSGEIGDLSSEACRNMPYLQRLCLENGRVIARIGYF